MHKKFTKEEFLQKVTDKYKGKYDYSLVEYKGTRTKIQITCPIHGVFEQKPCYHLHHKYGCPKCFRNSQNKLSLEKFIYKASKVHENYYNYKKVSSSIHHKDQVIIVCPIHGDFKQKPRYHLAGNGCQKCAQNKRVNTTKVSKENFLKLLNLKHEKDKYDLSRSIYQGLLKPITLRCIKHNISFTKIARTILYGKYPCPKCLGELISLNKRSNIDTFVNKAQKVFGNLYSYEKANYINEKTQIEIQCKLHGSFWVKPNQHLYLKQKCPSCTMSLGESLIILFLRKTNINFIRQKTFNWCKNPRTGKKLRFDFYLPDYNLCVEYDGQFHYKNCEMLPESSLSNSQYRDEVKNTLCKDNHVFLLRIPYWELGKINLILEEYLISFKDDKNLT